MYQGRVFVGGIMQGSIREMADQIVVSVGP